MSKRLKGHKFRECTCDWNDWYWDVVNECYRCKKCHGREFKQKKKD